MRSILYFQFALILVVLVLAMSCGKQQNDAVAISPYNNANEFKALLSNLAGIPQLFTIKSHCDTIITGEHGTIVHVDPKYLKTVDGSSTGSEITVELFELTDKPSLVRHSAETRSAGRLLVTGGAYYINMTSAGTQLKTTNEKGVRIEFPKLTDLAMSMFLGKRDSTGIINWVVTPQNFKPVVIRENYANEVIDTTKMTDKEYTEYRKHHALEKKVKRYDVVALTNFGWINCDRFQSDPTSKVDVPLFIADDSVANARFYAVFKDINSLIIINYFGEDWCTLDNVPEGKEIEILGITSKGGQDYVFHQSINTATAKRLDVDFKATSEKEIRELIEKLN